MNEQELEAIFPIAQYIDIFNLPGKFTSAELTTKLALLHRRKGWLNVHVRDYQAKLSNKNYEGREYDVNSLNKLLKEQSSITELLKEHNVLLKKAIDQLFIAEVQRRHGKIFEECLQAANEAYEKKNSLR